MRNEVGKFTFEVPADSPVESERGKKVEKAFEYPQCDTEQEAQQVLADKKWTLVSLVNENLKKNARSNSYQAALAPHRPSEVSPEDIKERMIRDYIRLGFPEEVARTQIEAMLANKDK